MPKAKEIEDKTLSFAYTPIPLYPYAPSYPVLSSISKGEGVIAYGESVAEGNRKRRGEICFANPLPFAVGDHPYTPIPLCTFGARGDRRRRRGDLIFDFRRIAKLRRGDRLRRKAQESKAKKG